jgi:hypothetical protein
VHGGAKGFVEKPPKPFTADSVTVLASDTNDWDEAQAFRQQRKRDKWEDIKGARLARQALVDDPAHPAHWNAIADTLNREEGPITQKVEVKKPLEELSDDELASAIDLLKRSVAADGIGSGTHEASRGKPH